MDKGHLIVVVEDEATQRRLLVDISPGRISASAAPMGVALRGGRIVYPACRQLCRYLLFREGGEPAIWHRFRSIPLCAGNASCGGWRGNPCYPCGGASCATSSPRWTEEK